MSRLKDNPFEIVAISLDDERNALTHMLQTMQVPGIQTWDNKGRENTIAKQYNVLRLPTWYLIDKRGVIRARNPFGDALITAAKATFKI